MPAAPVLIREPPGHYEHDAGVRGLPTSDQQPTTSDLPLAPDPCHLPLSEATLAHLWAGQRFPASALMTRDGVPVLVLHPGRAGRGAGPDFRDALIATPSGRVLRGDVELHVRASDFRVHGHDRDPRYDRLVLHVVFEDDGGGDTRLADGRRVPVVALTLWVRSRARELEGWLAAPRLWREPCHDAVARLGREEVLRVLDRLGDERFAARQAAVAADVATHGPGEALYRALLSGLGYGGDRHALEEIAERLPWRQLADLPASGEELVDLAEASLLGAAGLLPSQQGMEAGHAHERRLEGLWRARGGERAGRPQPAGAPSSLRPANHPGRRLAGLARLLVQHRPLMEGTGPLRDVLPAEPRRLIAAWTVSASGYWRERLAPGVPGRGTGALIGRSRAIELLVNAVLPWAAALAEAAGEHRAREAVLTCYAQLPRPARYGALAFLEANLRDGACPLPLDARRQQGLLALYKTECTQGGCGRCALS